MKPSDRMESLDTLRGVAILMVVAFHVSKQFLTPDLLKNALVVGNLGVQLFFLISAVTMCHMWEKRQGESSPTLKFYIRRAFRIAPPFWFALLFYTLLKAFGPSGLGDIGAVDIGLTAAFLHAFSVHAINLVVPGGWSIAVEMSFYLVFPLLVRRFRTPLSRIVLAFVLYLIGAGLSEVLKPFLTGGDVDLFLYYSLLNELPVFPLGMALYAVVLGRQKLDWRKAGVVLVLWVAVAFLAKQMGYLGRPFFWLEVFALAGFMALVFARNWNLFPLNWGGRWSYSIYLFHFAVLDLLVGVWGGNWLTGYPNYFAGLLTVCLLTGAVAWASSRTLEAWSMSWAKALIKRMKP